MPMSSGHFTPHELLMQRIEWALESIKAAEDAMAIVVLKEQNKQQRRKGAVIHSALREVHNTLLETRGALSAYHTCLTRDGTNVDLAKVPQVEAGKGVA